MVLSRQQRSRAAGPLSRKQVGHLGSGAVAVQNPPHLEGCAMDTIVCGRRAFGAWVAGALAARSLPVRAQPAARPRIADIHSHYAMYAADAAAMDLRRDMDATGTGLVTWAIVDDSLWVRRNPQGISQVAQPAPGELWDYFGRMVGRYDAALRRWDLPKALTPADVDAALAGRAHVVMASESANFLEGRVERVAAAYAMGLRHLQLVHYIQTPLGDLQTEPPKHNGMPAVALQVIQECQRLGILVDLAHSPPEFVDAAMAQSQASMIWSHSWISRSGGTWRSRPYVARSLSPAQARKFAARGGVIGLWTARIRGDTGYPLYSVGSYADEIMRMADVVGPRAVAFGTDMEGVGPDPVLPRYADLREVVDNLVRRGVAESTLQDICFGNYARALKKAMGA
jgi:membrane dipeptidase